MSVANSPNVVWKPLPGTGGKTSSQSLILSCPANEVLSDGTRGGAKTESQLMRFRRNVGKYGPFWRGLILDREYKNLDDIVARGNRLFPLFNDGGKWHASKADYKWTWPSGEELLVRSIKDPADYGNFHGQEFPFIGWNELTKFPDSMLYDKMMSCNRCGRPDVPLWVHSTTNPSGPGHTWVKKRFIDPAPAGKLIRVTTNAFNPATQEYEDIVTTRVRIFSSYKENVYLSPQYIAGLENITNQNLKKAWLYGDWDVPSGGALDDVWGEWNLVPRFKVPSTWKIDRSMDWGNAHPFSVGWWAEADGEEIRLPDGKKWAPAKGSLFRIWEVYGAESVGTNKGIGTPPRELAQLVAKYDHYLLENNWIGSPVRPGPADNQIDNVRDRDTHTISEAMAAEGVTWTASDKSRGTRKIGLVLFRQLLENAKTGDGPGIYFMNHCKAALEILPSLPVDDKDPDDVDTDAEDHLYDECRYRILAGSFKCPTSPIDVHYPH